MVQYQRTWICKKCSLGAELETLTENVCVVECPECGTCELLDIDDPSAPLEWFSYVDSPLAKA